MTTKLVSFTICPFVQRAVIALEEKGADYEVEFIDLRDKPDWFLAISPRGKVPLLRVGDEVLFESQPIVEYLDETLDGVRLTSEDPVLRARERAWFGTISEELFGPGWRFESASTPEAEGAARDQLRIGLGRLDNAMEGRDYLSGDGSRFGLADLAAAPALYRLAHLRDKYGADVLSEHPNVVAWADRLLYRPSVQRSVPAVWEDDFNAAMRHYNSVHLA